MVFISPLCFHCLGRFASALLLAAPYHNKLGDSTISEVQRHLSAISLEGSPRVVHFRKFRNQDAPGITQVWNEALVGRGAPRLRHSSLLENYVFSKSYFDPRGFFVAVDEEKIVGFAHAGFGPSADGRSLDRGAGVTSLMAVMPAYQRRGLGSQLLEHSENYLKEAGATLVHAGSAWPVAPFYFGIYGGAVFSGILRSEIAGDPFLQKHGYAPNSSKQVWQRSLTEPLVIVDGRFAALRKRCEVRIKPRTGVTNWFEECVLGSIELFEFILEERVTQKTLARISVWEMDGLGYKWQMPAIGIVDMFVEPGARKQAMGKFLVYQMLRYLQEQFFGTAEVHIDSANSIGLEMAKKFGFALVDEAVAYTKPAKPSEPPT
jgi:GNAT superfamily N-acetyltransferase